MMGRERIEVAVSGRQYGGESNERGRGGWRSKSSRTVRGAHRGGRWRHLRCSVSRSRELFTMLGSTTESTVPSSGGSPFFNLAETTLLTPFQAKLAFRLISPRPIPCTRASRGSVAEARVGEGGEDEDGYDTISNGEDRDGVASRRRRRSCATRLADGGEIILGEYCRGWE